MAKAFCLIRETPGYRRDAFVSGLQRVGYTVELGERNVSARPGDVVVIWNRYATHEVIADNFEKRGGTVLVAENGYVQGRHDGGDFYALARHAHNGRGQWPDGGPERWAALGVELKPWRTRTSGHVLAAANRTFGMRGGQMPSTWPNDVVRRLRAQTSRELRVRLHPAVAGHVHQPLEHDLQDAYAVAIWSSSVGVKALIEGIPVICESPWWICKEAQLKDIAAVDMFGSETHRGVMVPIWEGYRERAMHRLAWAQWSVTEIASGEPFARLLALQSEAA